eukprot:CAMPEP_0171150184 /NCGR_PEP_ID=MMETSP0766_2-20121228/149440_1 /TAXON_ID=439317 /ORGANISM="Gambierdiscus australes, Strain CAWD 149" /LENGTH=97 /DNA_ID=CAMNT_0011614097 /DNA_START=797 /DNA_END=1090 /DNA_ORIENTATION=-
MLWPPSPRGQRAFASPTAWEVPACCAPPAPSAHAGFATCWQPRCEADGHRTGALVLAFQQSGRCCPSDVKHSRQRCAASAWGVAGHGGQRGRNTFAR